MRRLKTTTTSSTYFAASEKEIGHRKRRGQTVRDCLNPLQRDGLTGRQTSLQRISPLGFHAKYQDVGVCKFRRCGHAADQPAADRNNQRLKIGALFNKFRATYSSAKEHMRTLERVHHGAVLMGGPVIHSVKRMANVLT